MNFSELYNNNRKAVERALIAMWCGDQITTASVHISSR